MRRARARNKHGMATLAAIVRPVLDFALPPRCPSCGAIVEDDHRFCIDCWSSLDFLAGPGCAGCGSPFDYDRGEDALCARCIASPPAHDGVRAAVAYGEVARAVALKLKYGRRPALAETIARHLVRHARMDPDALLVPVPLHRWRIWSRGFNQSALIARALAGETRQALALDALARRKPTASLRGLGAAARARVVRGAFVVPPQRKQLLKGRTLLLIDDVFTSGATAAGCARALKRAGAARVVVLCWARVLHDEEPPSH